MTPKPTQFRARIEGSPRRLVFADSVRASAWLAAQPEGEYAVTVERWRERRSNSQNAYYWGVIVPMVAEHCGYSEDEAATAIEWHFLQVAGSNPPTARCAKALTTVEFSEHCSRVRQWASATLGVYIPEPNEDVTIGM